LQKEKDEVIRKDREEEEKALKQILKLYDEDEKAFFKYADEIIEESKEKGRNLYPVLRAIQVRYKTEHSEINKAVDLESNIWKELCTEV
jgi:hypothetical protein